MSGYQVRWTSSFDGVERVGEIMARRDGVYVVRVASGEMWTVPARTVRPVA